MCKGNAEKQPAFEVFNIMKRKNAIAYTLSVLVFFIFDLTPIKEMYQEAYRQKAGTLIFRLKEAPDGELTYEFGKKKAKGEETVSVGLFC